MSITSILRNNLAHPIVLGVLALILVPILFLPLGIDQCTFVRASQVMFNGGKLYSDYYEQKTPLVFFLYGIGGFVFGDSDVGYRAFDLLWQLLTVFSLLYCIKKITGNQLTATISAFVYVILYCSMGHSETMQCESFIAPLVVWLVFLSSTESYSTSKSLLLRGILTGFCFGMKFTFGLVFVSNILEEMLSVKKGVMRRILLIGSGFALGSVSSLWMFFNPLVLQGYLHVLEYTRAYASTPQLNFEFFRIALLHLGHFFGDNISLAITVASAFGVGISIQSYNSETKIKTDRMAQICILLLIAFMFSIVIERKFFPYHYLRIYIPLSVLSSLGVSSIISFIRRNWMSFVSSWKVILTLLCLTTLFMSPLPRFAKNIRASYSYFMSNGTNWLTFQSIDDPSRFVEDSKNIASFIRSSHKKGRTFAFATSASYLYRQLDERPFSRFSMPMYYYAKVTPKGAYEEMFEEVKQVHWLVAQTNDVLPALYGHTKSSWECVRQDTVMFKYLSTNFTKVKEIGAFYVFERNE